jgi:hypothetical protein
MTAMVTATLTATAPDGGDCRRHEPDRAQRGRPSPDDPGPLLPRLENHYTRKGIVGSNPTLSARSAGRISYSAAAVGRDLSDVRCHEAQ